MTLLSSENLVLRFSTDRLNNGQEIVISKWVVIPLYTDDILNLNTENGKRAQICQKQAKINDMIL